MINWGDYPNFTKAEFDCKHTGRNEMSPDFMHRLQQLRTRFGRPMVITSGYRHPTHPIEARKPNGPGAHATGRACDVAVVGWDAMEMVFLAVQMGFTGIGIKQHGPSRFIHLDDLPASPGRPRPWMWSYP